MIPNPGIWQAANLMMKRYCAEADVQTAMRGGRARVEDDCDG